MSEEYKPKITDKKKEMLAEMPDITTKVITSKDGEAIGIAITFTKWYNKKYFEKVMTSSKEEKIEDL